MDNLKNLSGIPERELLYQLLSGLKLVNKNLEKYPNEIQLKEATFCFSTNKMINTSGGFNVLVGFEKSKTKEYSEGSQATYDFEKIKSIRYFPTKYAWKENGLNLQLEFAGYLMREIADEIIVGNNLGIHLKNIIIEKSFSVVKTDSGLLNLKFLSEKVDISANRKSAKSITNSIKVVFETR